MENRLHSTQEGDNYTDFDLHDIVGIRLINPAPNNVIYLDRQLGRSRTPISREPDIVIEFVEDTPNNDPSYFLGSKEFAFTKDTFFIFTGKQRKARFIVPFDQIGRQCRIVSFGANIPVTLLLDIINFTALAKGVIPVHATAFSYKNIGFLSTGWSGSGKTGALLSFMAQGARFVSSEHVFISSDGRVMHGIPQPIRLKEWHLRSLPGYKNALKSGQKRRLQAIKLIEFIKSKYDHAPFDVLPTSGTFSRALSSTVRRLAIDVSPYELFGQENISQCSTLDKVILNYSYDRADISFVKTDSRDAASRISSLHAYDNQKFKQYYQAFCFAFPYLRNDLIEHSSTLLFDRLNQILADKEIFELCHPYPSSLPALFQAINQST